MKNASNFVRQALAALFLLVGLTVSSYAATPVQDCNCSSPTVTITGQSSNSVTFSWGAVPGATGYRAWFVRVDDNFTSQQTATSGTTVSFSNLPKGKYRFYFVTDCGSESSGIIVLDDLMMG